MVYKVELSPFAEKALLDLALYISQDKPLAALEWVDYLEDMAFSLAENPYSGKDYKRGYRTLVLKKGYLVYYRVEEENETVFVMDFGNPGQPLKVF